MKARYFSILAAGLWTAAFTDGCSLAQTVGDRVGEEVLNESSVYECSLDETAGMVPHHPNEMHCCMTDVEEHAHDKPFSLTGNAGDEIEIGAEVPNYIRAELKAAGKLTFGVSGSVVRSFQAKHAPQAHCATHTTNDEGQCKPKYVRSRYDIEGLMAVHSDNGYKVGTVLLGLLSAILPLKLSLGGNDESLVIERSMSLCVEADHTDSECSPPVECQNGQGPGCALTDAGASEGGPLDGGAGDGSACSLDGSGCTDAEVDPCDGLVGGSCFACCEQNAGSQAELDSCILDNQCQ